MSRTLDPSINGNRITGALVYSFQHKGNIVIQATAHCMGKVEDDFKDKAPTSYENIEGFLRAVTGAGAKKEEGTK